MKTLTETITEAIEAGVSADGIVKAITAGLDAEKERCAQICEARAKALRETLSLTHGRDVVVRDTEQGIRELGAYIRGFADGQSDCAEALRDVR